MSVRGYSHIPGRKLDSGYLNYSAVSHWVDDFSGFLFSLSERNKSVKGNRLEIVIPPWQL
jgi:hypothetical protein